MFRVSCFFLATFLVLCSAAFATEETMEYGKFGKITLYRKTPQPSHVVLFVSGDGGWNLGVVDMARSLSDLDALVVGVSIGHYLKEIRKVTEPCSDAATDFDDLSRYVQKQLGFQDYRMPILVGYSSGATLVYAILTQAKPDTFRGAISMGFCPDLPLGKPFCEGHALKLEPAPKSFGYNFLPTSGLTNTWIAFQGTIDQVCDPNAVTKYVQEVKNGELVLLPKVGHGFSVDKNWLPQFRKAFIHLTGDEKLNKPEKPVKSTKPTVEEKKPAAKRN